MGSERLRTFLAQLDARITLLTALLITAIAGGGYWYWNAGVLPALRADAVSNARFQSQALANQLGELVAPGIGAGEIERIGNAIDVMLLFEHPVTQRAFLERIELEFDPDLVRMSPDAAVLARGEPACESCFVAEVPVYAARSRELIAIGRFFASDEFFRSLRNEVQGRLLQALVAVLIVLAAFWWLLTHFLRPFKVLAESLKTRDLDELQALPPLPIRASTELRMITQAFEGLFRRLHRYTESLKTSRDALARQSRERAQLNAELERKNAELERFTYTVSHDLKSPLITIRGFVGLLEKDLEAGDRDRVKVDLRQISGAADMMYRLLDDLLELSRIGRIVNPSELTDLGDLVEEALGVAAGRLEARDAEVFVAETAPSVFVDRQRLLEVLVNLIDNAVKFVPDDRQPQIQIDFEEDARTVSCHIRDNGIGIAAQYHEKIFGLFERLDPAVEGTGIGLALVKRIVELHRGSVGVESAGSDQGSRFSFSLPRVPEDAS